MNQHMSEMKGQLTFRGLVIGCLGCVVITATSAYTALKMGALPWPIIFAAIISLFFLKAVSKGSSTLNEANVTHTVMSAGSMVAGGLAFTIPGAWMLGLADEISFWEMLVVALAGVVLGLVCTAVIRRHFVEEVQLEFPIGQAAAQTLQAGESGGSAGKKLFGAMGFSALFGLLRDGAGVIPSLVAALPIPGVTFGIYASPMMLAVGFLVGTAAVCVWFAGAVIGNFGIIVGGTAAGLWDLATAQAIVSSLGMGVMIGSGVGVIVRDILPRAFSVFKGSAAKGEVVRGKSIGLIALGAAAAALVLCFALGLSPLVSLVVVALAFVTTAMGAQSVGQTGIDPMEIFGLIVLLVVAAFSDTPQVQLFFIAAVIAVACGLAGDVMNDFKAGHMLGTSPKAQMAGQAIGAVLGAIVSVAVMALLLSAYGPDAFGPQGQFVSAQASVVATMVSGIPHVAAFVVGTVCGLALYVVRFPSMMLGLGIYLPFYLSFTAFLGCMAKLVFDFVLRQRAAKDGEAAVADRMARGEQTGLVVASGLLGGEAVIGIILSLIAVLTGMSA